METPWITTRQSKSLFLALCDIAGSLDGSTNLFIGPLREHPSKELLSNDVFYRTVVLALCSALAIIDGFVHYHMYSHPKYDPKANAKLAISCSRSADLESQGDQSQLDRTAPPSSKQFMLLSEHSLAFLCAVACSLEVISVPFAALELLKDNEILSEDNSSSVYYTTLGLTLFALVVNVLNASVMYKLSRDNLTSNDQSNSSSVTSSWSQNITMLQSGSRVLFEALSSVIENTNFIIKLCQSVGYLANDQEVDLPDWAKWLTMSLFAVLAVFVAVANYYTYQYYNSDGQNINNPSDHGGSLDMQEHSGNPIRGISEGTHLEASKKSIAASKGCSKECCPADKKVEHKLSSSDDQAAEHGEQESAAREASKKSIPASNGCSKGFCPADKKVEHKSSSFDDQAAEHGNQESAAKDTSLFAEPVKTGCRKPCCSEASGLRTPFTSSEDLLRMGLDAEDVKLLKKPLLPSDHLGSDQDAKDLKTSHEPSTNKAPLSEDTAKMIAILCTVSSVVKRMAVPFAFISLFQSSGLLRESREWRMVGLSATIGFGVAGLWSSDVVYDFKYFHLTNDHETSCECCH